MQAVHGAHEHHGAETGGQRPLVWILWRRRKGDLDQMLALTGALGWPVVVKTLSFHPPAIPALASQLLKSGSDCLAPPWPDVVLCAEALPSIIARQLKEKSGGRIKTICVGRPAGTPEPFDLVITTAQYRLKPAPNIVELAVPLTPSAIGLAATTAGKVNLTGPQRPLIALAVGAASFPDRLDRSIAHDLALAALGYAIKANGTLVVLTGPRTPPDIAECFMQTVRGPHRVHAFSPGADNPYRQILAAADEIIVTSDSVSMVADALETGHPVSVYRLPVSRTFEWQLMEWLYRNSVTAPLPWLRGFKWLFDSGVIEISADRGALFDKLAADGRIGWFGQTPPAPRTAPIGDDLDRALTRMRALL
jgi:uncharacterized protein